VHGSADVELDSASGQIVDDVAGVGQGSGEPIELGHHQSVTVAADGECLAQSGSGSGGASEPVIDVDPFRFDAHAGQSITLGGEVLLISAASAIANIQPRHGE
jgi:hypothetical protein